MITLKATTVALSLLAVSLTLSAHASVPVDLVSGSNGTTVLEPDQRLLFYLDDDMENARHIIIGNTSTLQNGVVQFEVDPMWQDTYYFEANKLPTSETPYRVVSDNGDVLASGVISNPYLDIDMSRSTTLLVNSSSSYVAEKKPEPTYYDMSNVNSGSNRQTLRGYW